MRCKMHNDYGYCRANRTSQAIMEFHLNGQTSSSVNGLRLAPHSQQSRARTPKLRPVSLAQPPRKPVLIESRRAVRDHSVCVSSAAQVSSPLDPTSAHAIDGWDYDAFKHCLIVILNLGRWCRTHAVPYSLLWGFRSHRALLSQGR